MGWYLPARQRKNMVLNCRNSLIEWEEVINPRPLTPPSMRVRTGRFTKCYE